MSGAAKDLFAPGGPKVFTMPASAPFLKNLAVGLKTALGGDLHTAMILLPTRRAVRELTDAFLDASAGRATLLPLMRTLADMDENEPPFEPGTVALDVKPSIDSTRMRFELAQLVASKMSASGPAPDAAAALAMTEPLISLLGDLAMEELGVGALDALNEKLDLLPAHFQNAAKFVKIIQTYWPEHLRALNLSEPMARRVALLDAAAKAWQDNPPNHPVIIAGSTGTLGAAARLIKTVAGFEKGCVVLPGLDKNLDDKSFEGITDQHPQASLKNLIKVLGLTRSDISDWPGAQTPYAARMRARILSESLIPADSTADWPARIARIQDSTSADNPVADGLQGLSLIEAKTEEEEAAVIALIMRETLQKPGKICALVTPDPSLARRVRAKLSRWDVEVDSSAGEPLEETLHGSFLTLSAELALDPFDPLCLTALIKHKLFVLEDNLRHEWNMFEAQVLRGPRPKTFSEMECRLNKAKTGRQGLNLLKTLHQDLAPLHEVMSAARSVPDIATAHIMLAEKLSGGAAQIWRGEAGEKAAAIMEELISYGNFLPETSGPSYLRLLSLMMRGRVVRPRYGTHERLQILGPLEARMLDADSVILGGLNEGIWPAHPAPHPVLSRGMRLQIGLSAPERRFGLAAHDFAQLAAKPNVIMTRAARTADGPSVMSRWLWRLGTLARGALGDDVKTALKSERPYLAWARELDKAPPNPKAATRPAPRPPMPERQDKMRALSVTQIQTWVRDPYALYARKILGLSPLDQLSQSLGGREFGTAVHAAFESYAKDGDDKSAGWLKNKLAEELAQAGYDKHSFARFDTRLEEMAHWFAKWIRERKNQGWRLANAEKKGTVDLATQDGPDFVLTGIADRIETSGAGAAIIDYKTGAAPSDKVVQVGFDPQMPLLGLMLSMGAFGKPEDAIDFLYVKPNASAIKDRQRSLVNTPAGKIKMEADELSGNAYEALQNLIAHFDKPESAYYSQPRAQYVNPYGDYDHLARRAEWAKLGGEDGT